MYYEKFLGWFWTAFLAVLAVMTDNVQGFIIALYLVVLFMVGDYISGVFVSKRIKREGIKSNRTRWSFAKYFIYISSIFGTMIVGLMLHTFNCLLSGYTLTERTLELVGTINLAKGIMYVITWNESVSIVENLLLVYPNNKLLKILHAYLAFDFVKKIPFFNIARELKEDKDKKVTEQ